MGKESSNRLKHNESEIDWLKNNRREDIIILAQQKHFAILKRKYRLIYLSLALEPFYAIMVKLEKKERLDPKLVLQLMEEELLSPGGKIALAYYRLEAEFYEQEFHRTGNKWDIPTASSYWRKADEPEQALKLTNLDLNQIRESKLKSAISVTRGAAFRDMYNLADAEICAKKAMEYQPESYQPCTLMAAIAHDRGDYAERDYWYEQAIKRGAKPEDIDDERKRLVRSTKDDYLPRIYFMPEYLRTAIVTIHQLPCISETLWLRIIGRGNVQKQAIDELEALTPDNPFRKAALELLYNLQQNLQVTQNQDEEDRELLMRLAPLYQQDREQAIQEGEKRGLQTGIQQGERLVVENLLKVRFGEIDNELQAIIEPLLSLAPEEFTPLLLQLSREELIHRFC